MTQQANLERAKLRLRGQSTRMFLASLLVCLLAVMMPQLSQAQVLYGTVVGNVTDIAGAVVVGATVVATNTGTGVSKTATTDKSGTYRLSNLESGVYKVAITAKSFATTAGQGIIVEPNTERRFDAALQPASFGTTVTVTAAPPELKTDDATVSTDVESKQLELIIALPGSNERNFQSLYMVMPGIDPPAGTHSESGNPGQTMFYQVNGISGSNNNTRIDGVSDIYPWLPEIAAYAPSTEAIASVNVVTNSYNAEQGFGSGSVTNVTTKSGTNKFHGNAWDFNTISGLESKPFNFSTTTLNKGRIPKYVLNQFGANYSGPIKKDKLFFFGNWERTRRSQAFTANQNVPTVAMLTGDFSAGDKTIFDPLSDSTINANNPLGSDNGASRTQFGVAYNNTATGGYAASAGALNVIPASRIGTAVSTAGTPTYAGLQMATLLTKQYAANAPLAVTSNTAITNNYFATADGEYTRDNIDSRVDYNVNSSNTIFGRYGIQKTNLFDPQAFGPAGGNTLDGGQPGNAPSIIQSIGIGGTHTFRSNLLLDANIGYLRQGMGAKNTDIGTNWGTGYFDIPGTNNENGTTAFTCSLCGGMPSFNFNGLSSMGNPNRSNPFQFRDNTYTTAANLSWVKGKHSTRYGMEFQRYAINHFQPQNTYGPRGGFNFNGGVTSNGSVGDAYNAWADFLLGLPNLIQKDTAFYNPQALRENVYAFYAQDQWQVTPKLTVNYGIRYEYYPIAVTNRTGLNEFNPTDGLIYEGGVNGIPKNSGIKVGRVMPDPRFGISYRIDSKTVARAGYGIMANPDSYRNVLTNFPSVVSQSISGNSSFLPAGNTVGAATTYYSLNVGIPGIPAATQTVINNLATTGTLALGSLGTPAGTLGAGTFPSSYHRGYYETYNLALERELPYAFTVNASYVGDFIVREVEGININANQTPGQTKAQTPYNQCVTGSPYTNNCVQVANADNTVYGISAGITSYMPIGTGHYNSLQATAKRRFANNGSLAVNYTLSHSINDYGDNSDGEGGPANQTLVHQYWLQNRTTSGFDRTHNIEIFGNYLAPFGKGQAYLQHGPAGYILGGWEIAGSMSKESGTPFTVLGSSTSLGSSTTNLSQTADVVGKSNMINGFSGHPYNVNTAKYFNINNFQDPAVAEGAANGNGTCSAASGPAYNPATNLCRYGTAGRNSLRGPGFFNASLSMGRQFRLTDRYSFTVRAEAMNFTNTPSFGNPNSTTSSGVCPVSGTVSNNGTTVTCTPGVVVEENPSNFGVISSMASNYAPRTVRLSGRITF
jgi:hypothetical protein